MLDFNYSPQLLVFVNSFFFEIFALVYFTRIVNSFLFLFEIVHYLFELKEYKILREEGKTIFFFF